MKMSLWRSAVVQSLQTIKPNFRITSAITFSPRNLSSTATTSGSLTYKHSHRYRKAPTSALSGAQVAVSSREDRSFTHRFGEPLRLYSTEAMSEMEQKTMIPPPKSLLLPMNFPQKLLMGPGPSNAPPRVLAAGARPVLGHMHAEMWQILDEIKEGIQYAFQTTNKITLAVSASGHGGMEAACFNMLEEGEVVLVAESGIWGERFADMAERNGSIVRKITKPQGEVFSYEEIKQGLEEHKPSVMFIAHGESSSGTLQPLEGIGHLCHKYGTQIIVDSVAALGGVPMYMDKWGLDVVYTGSQKVLASPSGAAPISFSPSAWEKIKNRKTKVRSFYFDMNWLANYWGCDDEPRKYHHTIMSNMMYHLRESFAMLAEETLEACWERHQQAAQLLHKGLENMGLKLFVKDPAIRLPTVTTIELPSGIDWKAVNAFCMNKYKVEISGGLGPSAGKVWRIGVMGYNANPDSIKRTLRALEEGIQHVQAEAKAKL